MADSRWMVQGRDYGADRAIGDESRTTTVRTPVMLAGPSVPVVYFALAVGANLIKIGTVVGGHRVDKRMVTLQPGCPYDLKVLLVASGFGRREEARLHRLYAPYWQRGEWFRCEGALKELLQVAAVAGPDAACDVLRKRLA